MDYKSIGLLIRLARLEAGLTQAQLGKKVGITWEMISRYERGVSNPLQKIVEIAQALQRPVSFFLTDRPASEVFAEQQVTDSKYGDYLRSLMVPLFYTVKEYLKWQDDGVFTATYTVPLWLTRKENIMAVASDKVQSSTPHFQGSGIFFVQHQSDEQSARYLLGVRNSSFVIATHQQQKDLKEKVGTILAWEERFV